MSVIPVLSELKSNGRKGDILSITFSEPCSVFLPYLKMETKPEIYTKDFVAKELGKMLNDVLTNKEICYIGELFENKEYTRQRFSEWEEKFKYDDEISDTIKRIREILETRVNIGGLKQKLNPTMVIFNLKNNYKWKDTTTWAGDKENPLNAQIVFLPKKDGNENPMET